MFSVFELAIIIGFVTATVIAIIAAKHLFTLLFKTIPDSKKKLEGASRSQIVHIENEILEYKKSVYCWRLLLFCMLIVLCVAEAYRGEIIGIFVLMTLMLVTMIIEPTEPRKSIHKTTSSKHSPSKGNK